MGHLARTQTFPFTFMGVEYGVLVLALWGTFWSERLLGIHIKEYGDFTISISMQKVEWTVMNIQHTICQKGKNLSYLSYFQDLNTPNIQLNYFNLLKHKNLLTAAKTPSIISFTLVLLSSSSSDILQQKSGICMLSFWVRLVTRMDPSDKISRTVAGRAAYRHEILHV